MHEIVCEHTKEANSFCYDCVRKYAVTAAAPILQVGKLILHLHDLSKCEEGCWLPRDLLAVAIQATEKNTARVPVGKT